MLTVKLFVVVLLVASALVTELKGEENCHKLGILVYEDLGCKPERAKPTDRCPVGYDCRHFHDFGHHCLFQGEKYDINEMLPRNISDLSCNVGCFCNTDESFTCGVLDCPEWLGVPTKSPGCIRTYELDRCCSTGELCPPFDNVATCEVDGTTYKEGEKFFPKDTCSVCVCQKGFSGKYEAPYCRPISCAVELKHRKDLEKHCAPVYDDEGVHCCSSFWVCSSEGDVINPPSEPPKSNDKCIFGRNIMELGAGVQKVVERNGKSVVVKCECSLPPFLTCVVDKSQHAIV